MKSIFALVAVLSFAAAASSVVAQTPLGVTTLTMNFDVSNGIVAPAAASRVSVPYYEKVQLQVPSGWSHPIQWTKDGVAIAGATSATLTLPWAMAADSGTYAVTGAPWPIISTGIKLAVVPAERIANISSRQEIGVGESVGIVGFVVSGTKPKSLLFRAVGPSLASMNVPSPAALPRLKLFDAAGKELEFAHVAVLFDWPGIFSSVGAFPLTGNEREWIAYTSASLAPGAYTMHVSDDAKEGGTILAEVYELP